MNIIMSLDDNFVDYTKTTMASVLMFNNSFINFYLLTNSKDLKDSNFIKLQHLKECNIKIVRVPESLYSFLLNRKIFPHLTVATYFRHFAAQLIEDIDKAIYLDSDTLVLKDLTDLFTLPMNNTDYVLGAEDAASIKKKELWDLPRYINAGVLLMNLNYVRTNEDFLFKIKEFYRMYGNKTISGDQDMLNFVFRPNYFSIKYNLYHPFFNKHFKPTSCTEQEYYKCCQDPSIIHFVSSRKPWLNETKHLYKDRWLSTYNLVKHLEED